MIDIIRVCCLGASMILGEYVQDKLNNINNFILFVYSTIYHIIYIYLFKTAKYSWDLGNPGEHTAKIGNLVTFEELKSLWVYINPFGPIFLAFSFGFYLKLCYRTKYFVLCSIPICSGLYHLIEYDLFLRLGPLYMWNWLFPHYIIISVCFQITYTILYFFYDIITY